MSKWREKRLVGLGTRCEVSMYIPPAHIVEIAEERTHGIVTYFEEFTRPPFHDYWKFQEYIAVLARSCYMQGVNDTVQAAVTQSGYTRTEAMTNPKPDPRAESEPHGPVSERFMKHHYGASGYVEKSKRVGLESIAVEGVWLRRIGDWVEVLVEIDRKWRTIIREHYDGPFSHICEPEGIVNASYLEHDAGEHPVEKE